MKHTPKMLALILAICFIATIPLFAFAESTFDSYIVGNWKLQTIFNSEAEDFLTVSAKDSQLEINSDGTGVFYSGTGIYTVKWSYLRNIESGYEYNVTVDYKGSDLDLRLVYSTQDTTMDHAILLIGDHLCVYVRA